MKIRDLRPRERAAIFMSCGECGMRYSANADDYEGLHHPDVTMTCWGKNLKRVKKVVHTVAA